MKEQLNPNLRRKAENILKHYETLQQRTMREDIMLDPARYRDVAKELKLHEPLVKSYQKFLKLEASALETNKLLLSETDPEIVQMAEMELNSIEEQLSQMFKDLEILMLPRDPMDDKNIIVELRAGAGGEEAALFVSDLYRMYIRFAEREGWKHELLSATETGIGGYRDLSFSIEGELVYSRMKFESGVHRVQRVPATEASGRIHTSTITVAVMPEIEEVDFEINPNDVRIDTFCSSGPGGQSVNTTYSAVRLTHIPTGMVVSCQDGKSQIKNKEKAFKVLRARLAEAERNKQAQAYAAQRQSQVGSGDRSEKIRTYNFPQGRVSEHRIGLTIHNLPDVLDGNIGNIVDSLLAADQQARLEASLRETN